MWYRYLHSHTWESPHFGNETFDTKKSNIRDPSIFMYHPKRPAKTNHLSLSSTSLSGPQVALMFLLIWIRSEVQKASGGFGVVSLAFNQQQREVHRQWTWRKSGSNSWAKTKLGKVLRRSGKQGPYVHILVCIRCYVVVAISKHKGMFLINFNKM